MEASGCPEEAELSAFAVGDLSPAEVELLAEHLATCDRCLGRLSTWDERFDEVIVEVRRVTGRNGGAVAPALLSAGASEPVEGIGEQIGPYKLVELLGEGGFGRVFLAEQTQPIRRQVAIKLIKLGMDSRQILARFQAERQALAMMDHPNIARVLEAGTTERGQPFFVMELVRGTAITDYCDRNRLSVRQRLGLFIDVCSGVQHAHTKGIIHRDLKPNNVLVDLREDRPAAKVIDFGIAKAVGGGLIEQTLSTEIHHFLGTPAYISPEQADHATLDVDARADVYSLGVLLYELLTGTTPLDGTALRSKGLAQIGRAIRETDPPRPSTRVAALGGSMSAAAARRNADAGTLSRSLRGELDWIVMKCLEKERTLRYETVAALAADVRRYLQDEPVIAGAPGAAYQLRKFVRRHRAGVTAAATTTAALVLGLGLAVHGWVRAGGERDRAQEAQRAEARQRQRAEQAIIDRDAAAHDRWLAQANAVMTASPSAAITLLESLPGITPAGGTQGRAPREAILLIFRQRLASSPPKSLERLRSACALALLREPRLDELAGAIASAPASEGPLMIDALSAAASAPSPDAAAVNTRLAALAAAEPRLQIRARYAIALLFMGDDGAAREMLAPAPDPTDCSAFVAEFGPWHGDLSRLPELLQRMPEECRYGLCLAAGRADSAGLHAADRQRVIDALREFYLRSPSGGLHSACEFALRQWDVELPALQAAGDEAAPRRQWFVNRSGLTMALVPNGSNVLGVDRFAPPALRVRFDRPLFFSTREVPYSLVRQFVLDPAVPEADKARSLHAHFTGGDPGQPPEPVASNVTPIEAVRFCNWLSGREGRQPCYHPGSAGTDDWALDRDADGYRLPTPPEWEYAARAGAVTIFPCCDGGQHLLDFAALTLTAYHLGGRQPNRWGLFDMLGGVWEICWEPGRVVLRGGADNSGTADLRVASSRTAPHDRGDFDTGLRVVCAADPSLARPVTDSGGPTTGGAEERRARSATSAEKPALTLPTDEADLYFQAADDLYSGDRPSYLAARKRLIDLAADSSGAGQCERAAKTFLLDDHLAPGPELDSAIDLARRSVTRGKTSPFLGWYRLADGMAEYRAGHFDDAVARCQRAALELDTPGGQSLNDLFLAMSLHRSGHLGEAKAAMARASAAIERNAPLHAANWGPQHLEWLHCRIALREAERVLAGPAGPSTHPVGP